MAKHVETRVANVRKLFERAAQRGSVGHPDQAAALREEARACAAAAFDHLRALKQELRETVAKFDGEAGGER